MGKIFVRERTHIGRGVGRPRFVIVATEGIELKFYAAHVRKVELEMLAESVGAEIVYLSRGDKAGTKESPEGEHGGRRRRHHDQD
jgi:hypothetical protein